MRFRILGPLEAIGEDGQRVAPGPRPARLLAVLLLSADRAVPLSELVDAVWDDDPPATARHQIQSCVWMLRKRSVGVRTDGPGYRIPVDAGQLDATVFEETMAASQSLASAGGAQQALEKLSGALSLWRGPALAGLAGRRIQAGAARLNEMRLFANEQRLNLEIALGRHQHLVAELTELVAAYPLREQLAALLMRALDGSGRRAEALAVYQQVRVRFAEELGIEPNADLQRMHLSILRGDEEEKSQVLPSSAVIITPRVWAQAAIPRQLPASVRHFVGRAAELKELDRLIDEGSAFSVATGTTSGSGDIGKTSPAVHWARQVANRFPDGQIHLNLEAAVSRLEEVRHDAIESSPAIAAIDGMAGVGKTTLAVHAAHRLTEHYPDGQLFIDLHGYSEGTPPVEPGEALDRMLRALGVPGDQIPAQLDERAAFYRSRLADQRVLILLDNASDEHQVQCLLPGAPGCLVLVTSRHRLTGLDRTRTVTLDVLPLTDAVGLLGRAMGERLTDQPLELLAETVELCGRLPLAIRIVAARLRSHPAWDVAHLVGRLRVHHHLLAELEAGQRSVAAALDLSYQQLSHDVQRAYRLLGLHQGPDLDAYAAAALTDRTVMRVSRLIERLIEDHLLQETTTGRYRFHDLVGAHAAHLADAASTESDRSDALNRLLEHYAHCAAAAIGLLYPPEANQRHRLPQTSSQYPVLDHPAHASSWLDAELPNLLATAYHVADHGRRDYLLRLSATLRRWLRVCGRHRDAATLHRLALEIARNDRDFDAEVDALLGLGHAYRMQAKYTAAADHFEKALEIASATGSAGLEALAGVARIHRMQGRYEQATEYFEHVLNLASALGDRSAELEARLGLGWIDRLQRRYQQAASHMEQAQTIARAIGNHRAEVDAINALGILHRLQGRYELAIDHFELAKETAHAIGSPTAALIAIFGIGSILQHQEQYEPAVDHFQQVLDLARTVGNRNWQFEAIHGLGRVRRAVGRPDLALACHQQALELAAGLDQRADLARAYCGLAYAHDALGQLELAHQQWRRALDHLTALGVDQTEDEETTTAIIRAHLAGPQPETHWLNGVHMLDGCG